METGTQYGIMQYDHIALEGDTIEDGQMITTNSVSYTHLTLPTKLEV